MTLSNDTIESGTAPTVNVGLRLSEMARQVPGGVAVVVPRKRDSQGKRLYDTISFQQLDDDSSLLADGLSRMGVSPGMRIVLLVRPGIDFVSLVYALFKVGAVSVLIDPGMGRKNLVRCLTEVEPEGFVAIPQAHAVRCILRSRFPKARYNVTIGKRLFWGGRTIRQLRSRRLSAGFFPARPAAHDPAAVIFTTGSTGPPKGVLYSHGNFNQQVDELRDFYGIQAGEVDVATFPLFALFNGALGVTTVIPDMDPTKPASVDPKNIIEAVRDWKATQAFGSPALWNKVGRFCEQHKVQLPTLRRVLSAGAPVPPHVLRRMKAAIDPRGDIHTPYGATEALPVASISATEVLQHTSLASDHGGGTCVGRRFPGIQWKVIRISDDPLITMGKIQELRTGEIGELIVRGNVVTKAYVTCPAANPLHKIHDGNSVWHRMGDVGYLDKQGRFWFCGRKAHRLLTGNGVMFTIPCEAVVNTHPAVYRSALVGVGPRGQQRPVIVVETWPDHRPATEPARQRLHDELLELAAGHRLTEDILDVLFHPSLPVDIRHNAKIFREQLSTWASHRLKLLEKR